MKMLCCDASRLDLSYLTSLLKIQPAYSHIHGAGNITGNK